MTIRPNAKKLARLFLEREKLTWQEFSSRVRVHQVGFMGEPNERPGSGEFHENPKSCICEKPDAKVKLVGNNKYIDDDDDDQEEEEEEEEEEDGIVSNLRYLFNETNVDDVPLVYEENELEELLSD